MRRYLIVLAKLTETSADGPCVVTEDDLLAAAAHGPEWVYADRDRRLIEALAAALPRDGGA